jgi:hypothetical protein
MQEETENKQYKNPTWHMFQVMYKKILLFGLLC